MAAHHWQLRNEEHGITRQECSCGAVKFIVSDYGYLKEPEILKRITSLNETMGKGGDMTLHQETGDIQVEKPAATGQSPIPPKPKGEKGNIESNKIVAKYYEDNKTAILKDLAELGKKEMLKRWNIQAGTWRQKKGLAERWGIPVERRKDRAGAGEYDKNKESIIQDYEQLRLLDFLKKWHISSQTWLKLKKQWQITGKSKPSAETETKPPERTNLSPHAPVPPMDLTEERKNKDKTAESPQPVGLQVIVVRIPAESNLPPMPVYNDAWPEAVQLKWLETYRELAGVINVKT